MDLYNHYNKVVKNKKRITKINSQMLLQNLYGIRWMPFSTANKNMIYISIDGKEFRINTEYVKLLTRISSMCGVI